MARLSHTTLRTVRFYEAEGLIHAMERGDGDHRRFARSELRKLQAISDLRESGLSLREIKDLIELKRRHPTAPSAACDATNALCAEVAEIDRRIATLQRAREEMLSTVTTLRKCRECTEPDFPERCGECAVMTEGACSRTMHLLWKN
jgi:DNA-binding transcriptional MerR regulator